MFRLLEWWLTRTSHWLPVIMWLCAIIICLKRGHLIQLLMYAYITGIHTYIHTHARLTVGAVAEHCWGHNKSIGRHVVCKTKFLVQANHNFVGTRCPQNLPILPPKDICTFGYTTHSKWTCEQIKNLKLSIVYAMYVHIRFI